MSYSPIGLLVFPIYGANAPRVVSYPHYIEEVLAHAGVPFAPLTVDDLDDASLSGVTMLLTVGDRNLPEQASGALRRWVEGGGAWISIAGFCNLEELLGVRAERPVYIGPWGMSLKLPVGEGYLAPRRADHRVLAHLKKPLHFFNGVAAEAAGAEVLAAMLDKHQRPTNRAAVTEHRIGRGRAIFIAADVTGSIVHIQQGRAITRDGISSPDGLGGVCDGVLKSDDGQVLDWDFDRDAVPDVAGLSAFLTPIADQWRELALRAIFHAASEANVRMPVLWLYPRRLPAIAHMSHDTDHNNPERARIMLELLAKADICTTWCTILPGYDAKLTAAIREAGHELSMHYDALTESCQWSAEQFDEQHRRLTELFDGDPPISNKNHYLRWEGDCEFYDWCTAAGVQIDQSKGPSKPGGAGFNFGSCHPFFPVDPAGTLLDVLELPLHTQDLGVFIPYPFVHPMAEAALAAHGVLHLLFHPDHMDKPAVCEAMVESARLAKSLGMEWWTAKQINQWERARRTVNWRLDDSRVELTTRSPLADATLLLLGEADGSIRVNGQPAETRPMRCWGMSFSSAIVTLEPEAACVAEVE